MYSVPQADLGSNPGKPTWGPYLTSGKAIEYERTLICSNPTRGEWDRRADERQAAWEDSMFADALNRLLQRTP